jgi:hypothetical protein
VFRKATKALVCRSGYTARVRHVTSSLKDQVYAEYGIASHAPGEYEVDHLVPLELGGSNSIANLFRSRRIPIHPARASIRRI